MAIKLSDKLCDNLFRNGRLSFDLKLALKLIDVLVGTTFNSLDLEIEIKVLGGLVKQHAFADFVVSGGTVHDLEALTRGDSLVHEQEEVVVDQVVHVDLEAEVFVVAHKDRVELIAVLKSVLEVLVLHGKVTNTPLCLDSRLELGSWQLHSRLKLALNDHLVTVLHVVYDRIHNRWVLGERIARALLDLGVEIGVSRADDV